MHHQNINRRWLQVASRKKKKDLGGRLIDSYYIPGLVSTWKMCHAEKHGAFQAMECVAACQWSYRDLKVLSLDYPLNSRNESRAQKKKPILLVVTYIILFYLVHFTTISTNCYMFNDKSILQFSIDEKIQTAPVHLRFWHHQSSLSQVDRDHGRGGEHLEQSLNSTWGCRP